MSLADDFQAFWQAYPRRVGRLAAMAQFARAVKLASVEDIVAGVQRYIETKPDYADWCQPVTFLRQGRWMDEPDAEIVKPDMRGHVPACKTQADCLAKIFAEAKRARG